VAATESKLLYQLLIACRSVRLSFDPVQDFFVAKGHVVSSHECHDGAFVGTVPNLGLDASVLFDLNDPFPNVEASDS
jgi:uncharacterized membrane protein